MFSVENEKPRILFFDTETTGLRPGNICQLSYLIVDGNNIDHKNYYFKVDKVEYGAQMVHGLSVQELHRLSKNKSFKDHFSIILDDFTSSETLVAHNFNFDLNFLKAEYASCGKNFAYSNSLCTMRYFTNICKIPKSNGPGYKWPRLEELLKYFKIKDKEILKATKEIFGTNKTNYHDARFDTVAVYLCYMKGLEEGLIKTRTEMEGVHAEG